VNAAPPTIEAAVEQFLRLRRSGSPVDSSAFALRHAHLGPGLLDALESIELLESAHAEVPVAGFEVPASRVGPYQVVREIGRGGMGIVVEAVEAPLGRRVALKLLPVALLSSPSARARFQREAELASRLDDPGICTIFGAGVAGVNATQPWIAMRLVEGQTLAQLITASRERGERCVALPNAGGSGPCTLAIAACIARIARSLAKAHAREVVHRDVKPSNVMATPSGDPVLLDFGLAICVDSEAAGLTRTGEAAGTPAYLAPELISGELARPDAQCDVYSLGVTLYECLTLERPFRGATRDALYRAVLDGSAADVRDGNRDVSRDLAVVVRTAIERDRARRYASASLFAADLEAVVSRRPIAARPIGAAGRIARWSRREPRQALLAGALSVAALALALTGGVLLASRHEVKAGREAQREVAIENALVDGFSQLSSSRYASARAEFERALALDPQNVEARFGRIIVTLRSGRDAEALELLRSEPQTPAYDGLRAMASKQTPAPEDPAWLDSASATELAIDGWRLYIDAQRQPRSDRPAQMRRVLERFDEAILRSPRARPTHHQMRALAASMCGDERATRSACAALIALWPDSARVLYCAGSSIDFVDPRRACELLERSVELDPHYAPAFQCLGTCYFRLDRSEQARAAFQRAIEIDRHDTQAMVGLAMTLDPTDCPDEMRAWLRSAIAADPGCIDAWGVLGALAQSRDEPEEVVSAMYRVLELDPAQLDSRRLLAAMLSQLGQTDAAREQWEILMTKSAPSADLWAEYANLQLECGNAPDALEAIRVVRQFDPAHARLEGLEERARALGDSAVSAEDQ